MVEIVDDKTASVEPIEAKANILLVETSSASLSSLLAGVNYARDAAGVCPSASRLPGPRVAPRMNSTAQVAHIAQMPNITSHFSISPVL